MMTTTTLVRPSDFERTALASRPVRLRAMVVLDGCDLAQETLRRVSQIVRVSAGDVLLLRPLEPRLAFDPLEDSLTEEALLAEARRYLRHVAQQLALDSVNITIRVTTGLQTAEAISDTARQCAADLIVLVDG